MTSEDKERRYGPVVAVVNSKSQPDVKYEVRMLDGRFSCNCKGWIFNREQPKRCKHTDAVACTTIGLISPEDKWDLLVQAGRRKAAVDRRAGVGQPEDAVVRIVKKMMEQAGLRELSAGALMRMAGVLRPYLRLQDLAVVPQAVAVAARTNDLIPTGRRCITLDD